ncbi:unnamed protein product [Taenia asiatica]|uniref:t-SNARE coiled-coil homology domain-containing protein n=1 Tax=Taenia asiatica TaxID=60517 RepID=A0A0R3W213_TAEAS|nr:unnamed protein product [Taenia asiatica]
MHSSDHFLEIENNRRAEDLSVKVNLLKSCAREIRDETKEQSHLLDTIQYAADSAGSMLGKTVGRVMGISDGRRNNRKLLLLTIFTFLVVFIIYTIVRLLPL